MSGSTGIGSSGNSPESALGRAFFRSRQFEDAVVEFAAVVERAPTNDYALFCLGRALMESGRPGDARKPLTLAAGLRPDRRDYRIYRDRARAAAGVRAGRQGAHRGRL